MSALLSVADPQVQRDTQALFELLTYHFRDMPTPLEEKLAALLEEGKFDIHEHNFYGTLLLTAVRFGRTQAVRKLLEAGSDIEARGSKAGKPPLCIAHEEGNSQIEKMLLEAGASVHAQTQSGRKLKSYAPIRDEDVLSPHEELWEKRLIDYGKGTYTPSSATDYRCLASVLPLEDPVNPPSVDARLCLLREMRPDIGLGGTRAGAIALAKATSL